MCYLRKKKQLQTNKTLSSLAGTLVLYCPIPIYSVSFTAI